MDLETRKAAAIAKDDLDVAKALTAEINALKARPKKASVRALRACIYMAGRIHRPSRKVH